MTAYACEPGEGSEPGVGWHFAVAAAQRHDVTLVTRANNLPRLEPALAALPADARPEVVPLDLPRAARWKRGSRGVRSYYLLWQRELGRVAHRLQRDRPFDVLHHVTFGADWLPVGLTEVADEVPLVWGPVGGATGTPWHLREWLTPRGLAAEVARTTIAAVGRRSFGRRAASAATIALANNTDTAARLRTTAGDVVVHPHAVAEPRSGDGEERREPGRPSDGPSERVAVFAGRHDGWKGVLLAVDAIARAPGWRLECFGTGPDLAAARDRAERAGIADRVTFRGRVPLEEVHRALRTADALLFPSMHDSAPFVVAEAIALECPVVALARGGPRDMLRDGEGILVDDREPDLPGALAAALDVVPDPPPYDGRWSAARLPGFLEETYRRAVALEGRRHA